MNQLLADTQQRDITPASAIPPQIIPSSTAPVSQAAISPQSCPACAAVASASNNGAPNSPSYVYAIGNIDVRFPSVSVEKEFAQATARENTAGLTSRQALHAVLTKPENRYLVRKACFVMTIEGLDSYILQPSDPADFSRLVEAVRPNPSALDLDVVIGINAGIAPPETCNGLMVPIVQFDQIYSFDRDSLIQSIPKPKDTPDEEFAGAANELFDRIMQLADNAGSTDEHRALNYLVVRYPAIYAKAAQCMAQNSSLTAVDTQTSVLSGVRNILELIFSYQNRSTDVVEKCFVRVDVTEEFPFLVTKLSPYYDG
jgi:hypothetical protein